MYSRTRFREVLEGLPRGTFTRLVESYQADKFRKGFSSWDQLLAMVFAQLSGVRSLRELEAAFNEQQSHHYHLGTRPMKRSTLADANGRRSYDIFAGVCRYLMKGAHRRTRKEVGDMLYLLDSTPIHLCGLGFDWANQYRSNVSQGLKLHLLIEARQDTPLFAEISEAQVSDVAIGRNIPLEEGATYVFDKGYYDFNWWHQIEQKGATFVTRLKKNANVTCVQQYTIPARSEAILEDAKIQMNSRTTNRNNSKNPYFRKTLRRITVERADKDTPLVLVTNNFDITAQEVAQLYKKRWGIELFFKWIKQNLKLKSFLGRSENAVRTQLLTALISYLLVQLYQLKNGLDSSLKLCLAVLRFNLFQRPKTEAAISTRRRRRREYIDKVQQQLVF